MRTHDFAEGVRAVIVDKDNKPKWSPTKIEQLSKNQVEDFFINHHSIAKLFG